MLDILYQLGIKMYAGAIKLASVFSPKAGLWLAGRKNWEAKLKEAVKSHNSWIWFHCASLGEFEQARNLIEYLKEQEKEVGILLSFFSPSGYEIRKNYAYADYICYLPIDSRKNARSFISLLRPKLACFVKYEIWINYIEEMCKQEVPAILLSARVRPNSSFFKSLLSPLYKKAFASFTHIFTQDEISKELLSSFSQNTQISVSSDTRYDRVLSTKKNFTEIAEVKSFKGNKLCIVCGSTWPKAEKMLIEAFIRLSKEYELCMILAPHEIRESRIQAWIASYPEISLAFSNIGQLNKGHNLLWIDNIGMLSRLYHYGDIAYVGGGWGSGLHNILEAASFACPVLIGPKHEKFPEAAEMIEAGGCFEIRDQESLEKQLRILIEEEELRSSVNRINTSFISSRSGATDLVISWMKKEGFINN
ncbi:MAG: glycosyltransferase N-terminal domain-containing protein [Bacteroidota bacterium]